MIERTAFNKHHGKSRELIKTHAFVADRPEGSVVVHSTRNYQEAYESWMKMSPAIESSPEYLQALDNLWRPHADLIVHRLMLDDYAMRLITAVNICKFVAGLAYEQAVEVFSEVDELRPPKVGLIDSVTFLHSGHRNIGKEHQRA